MKKVILSFYLIILLLNLGSCVVVHEKHHKNHKDHGKHKGWYKNEKNPHNPNHTGKSNNEEKTIIIIKDDKHDKDKGKGRNKNK